MATESLEQQLYDWYQQPCGQALAETIDQQLQTLFPSLFGVRFLQLGLAGEARWANISPIMHKLFLSPSAEYHPSGLALPDELPIEADSIDVVFLPHTLEFYSHPQAILNEVSRVLAPDGHVIILGINPGSLWGLCRWRKRFELPQKPLAVSCISRHLEKDHCKVRWFSSFFFRPPVETETWLQRLKFLDSVGKVCWPYPGGAYIMVAQKGKSVV